MRPISAREFHDNLRILNGVIEREYEVTEDLSLHGKVTSGTSLVDGVTIAGCVFYDFKLVEDNRQSSPVRVTVPIVFRRCVFKTPLPLHDINFCRLVVFDECRFEKYVDCARSHFSGISFHDCAFDETVYFQDTCFSQRFSRDSAEYNSWGQDRNAVADFSGVTFLDGADFEKTVFQGAVIFTKALFYKATTFTSIRLLTPFNIGPGILPSNQSTDAFSPVFRFTSVQIFGSVGFRKSVNTSHTNASLQNFRACTCWRDGEDSLRLFEYKHRGGRTEALELDFTNTFVEKGSGLRFHTANLEKCKVVGTNLDACYFNNVRWPRVRAHFPVLALGRGKIFRALVKVWLIFPRAIRYFIPTADKSDDGRLIFGIYDHLCLVKEQFEALEKEKAFWNGKEGENWWTTKKEEWAQISKAYRDLKVAYELDKDYLYASDFHFGEKELRRISHAAPWYTRIQLNLFWLINGYGERALRPVAIFLLIVAVGALVYGCGGLSRPSEEAYRVRVSGESTSNKSELVVSRKLSGSEGKDWGRCEKTDNLCWWEPVVYSAATTAFLKPDFLVLHEGFSPARAMSWFQTIAGPALFGMFALAIRNKLKR